jgi:ribose/xylose/arabinose/galactoside ABC-type transport system permease subunit
LLFGAWNLEFKSMPDPLQNIAKLLITIGILIAALGVLLLLFRNSGIPFLGKLPGDIVIQKKNFTFYFPIATSILVSIILSLVFYFLSRK